MIRTLDVGGDKPIAYLPLPAEENPALGLRGIRTSLWRPELLRRAAARAAGSRARRRCRILLPMITDVAEFQQRCAVASTSCAASSACRAPQLGAMIETPAAAMLADQIARVADFLSIGTNDLAQYTLAMDRGHAELAARIDGVHPAVLRLIDATARGAATHRRAAGGVRWPGVGSGGGAAAAGPRRRRTLGGARHRFRGSRLWCARSSSEPAARWQHGRSALGTAAEVAWQSGETAGKRR